MPNPEDSSPYSTGGEKNTNTIHPAESNDEKKRVDQQSNDVRKKSFNDDFTGATNGEPFKLSCSDKISLKENQRPSDPGLLIASPANKLLGHQNPTTTQRRSYADAVKMLSEKHLLSNYQECKSWGYETSCKYVQQQFYPGHVNDLSARERIDHCNAGKKSNAEVLMSLGQLLQQDTKKKKKSRTNFRTVGKTKQEKKDDHMSNDKVKSITHDNKGLPYTVDPNTRPFKHAYPQCPGYSGKHLALDEKRNMDVQRQPNLKRANDLLAKDLSAHGGSDSTQKITYAEAVRRLPQQILVQDRSEKKDETSPRTSNVGSFPHAYTDDTETRTISITDDIRDQKSDKDTQNPPSKGHVDEFSTTELLDNGSCTESQVHGYDISIDLGLAQTPDVEVARFNTNIDPTVVQKVVDAEEKGEMALNPKPSSSAAENLSVDSTGIQNVAWNELESQDEEIILNPSGEKQSDNQDLSENEVDPDSNCTRSDRATKAKFKTGKLTTGHSSKIKVQDQGTSKARKRPAILDHKQIPNKRKRASCKPACFGDFHDVEADTTDCNLEVRDDDSEEESISTPSAMKGTEVAEDDEIASARIEFHLSPEHNQSCNLSIEKEEENKVNRSTHSEHEPHRQSWTKDKRTSLPSCEELTNSSDVQMKLKQRLLQNLNLDRRPKDKIHAFSLNREALLNEKNTCRPVKKFQTKPGETSKSDANLRRHVFTGVFSLEILRRSSTWSFAKNCLKNERRRFGETKRKFLGCHSKKDERAMCKQILKVSNVTHNECGSPSDSIVKVPTRPFIHLPQIPKQCRLEGKQPDICRLLESRPESWHLLNSSPACTPHTVVSKQYSGKNGIFSVTGETSPSAAPIEVTLVVEKCQKLTEMSTFLATPWVRLEETRFLSCEKDIKFHCELEASTGMIKNSLGLQMEWKRYQTDQPHKAEKKIGIMKSNKDGFEKIASIPQHNIGSQLPETLTLSANDTGQWIKFAPDYCRFPYSATETGCLVDTESVALAVWRKLVFICRCKALLLYLDEVSQDNLKQMPMLQHKYPDSGIDSQSLKSDIFSLGIVLRYMYGSHQIGAVETCIFSAILYQKSPNILVKFIVNGLKHIHKDLKSGDNMELASSQGMKNAVEKCSDRNSCKQELCVQRKNTDCSHVAMGYFGVEVRKCEILLDIQQIQAINLIRNLEKFEVSLLKCVKFAHTSHLAISGKTVSLIFDPIQTADKEELLPLLENCSIGPWAQEFPAKPSVALTETDPTFPDDKPTQTNNALNDDNAGTAVQKMLIAPESSYGEDHQTGVKNANEDSQSTRAFPNDDDETTILKSHDQIPKISDIYKHEANFLRSELEFIHILREWGTNEKRNCSPPNSRMNEESARRSSFVNRRNRRFNADDFAVAGFYLHHDDVMECYSCGVEHEIEEIDSAPATSRWHHSGCRHLANIRNPKHQQRTVESDGRVSDDIADPPGQQSIYIPPGDIRREAYRLSTFEQFPVTCAISRKSLAKSGFYFTGFYDRVKCFACARTVERWEEIDNPAELKWHKTACPLPRGEECGNVPIPSLFQAIAPAIQAATATTPAPAPGSSTSGNQPANQAGTTQSGERILEQRDPNTGAIIRRVRYPADLPERIRQTGGTFEIGPNNEVIIRSGPGPGQQNPANVGAQSQPRRQWRMANVISADHKRFLTNLFLNRELDRLASFARWPVTRPNIAPAYLAKSGFFYLGDMDRTQCFSCGGVLRNWKVDDDAAAEHRTHFPQCRMVLGVESRNIPLHEHPETEEEKEERYPCRFPSNPHMRSEQARLGTFDRRWPMGRTAATPAEIAQGGFFFLGERDRAKCWYCNGGLQNWEYDDIPWIEHAKWFPNCQFLLRVKGQHFVYRHLALNPHLARPIIARQDGSPLEAVGQPAQGPQALRAQDIPPPRESAARQPTPPPTIIDPQEEMRKRKERVQNIMRNSDIVKNVLAMGFDDKIVAALLEDKINSGNEANPNDIYESASQLLDDVFKKEEEVRKANEERSRQSSATAQPPSLPGPASLATASSMYSSISGMSGMSSIGPPPGSGKYNVSYYDDEGEDERMDQDMYGSMEGTSASITSVTAAKRLQGAEENSESLREALNKIEEERMCKICFTNQADMVFVPCSHMCCCMECTQAIRQCPVCRKKIDKAIKTYLN